MEEIGQIKPVNIEQELKQSYLDYAMSVIVGRALPDVRDGLKPVHKRILYAMHNLSNDWNRPYKKSARVVGDVIGKYHPHGDSPVYDAIVRMAQDFSMRYPLIDGQGNFGSVDGDAPAAMRYTEVRMTRLSSYLLADLEKDTVDFYPNYDGSEQIPEVLPTRVPNLLVNGSSGIAVGMATNIPPHHLGEVIDAVLAYIDNPEISLELLLALLPGPDFPTGGVIQGRSGIISAYATGRGKIDIRGVFDIETHGNHEQIIITELPYQVNKARFVEKVAELVRDKRLEGISGLRDESDKDGMRVVIELKRGENAQLVVNHLYAHTQLRMSFGINMVALVDGQPRCLSLKQLLAEFVRHRREVVVRRTQFELKKALEKAHLLAGLGVAISNVDEMIALIKSSESAKVAKEALMGRGWSTGLVANMLTRAAEMPVSLSIGENRDGLYWLSEAQTQAILDLKLQRLTGLEREKILKDFSQILEDILGYQTILSNEPELLFVIRSELNEIRELFTSERRTMIEDHGDDILYEDLIQEEDLVITLSQQGYVKSQPLADYQAQHRGGRGKSATQIKTEDVVAQLWVVHSHDNLLCFSNLGQVYQLKTYQIPSGSRVARGLPFVNVLPLSEDEHIQGIIPVPEFDPNRYVIMATANATIKKVSLSAFANTRRAGIRALEITEGDKLIGVSLSNGEQDIFLFSSKGRAIRFAESDLRPMGRTARGVRGMKLPPDGSVVALVVLESKESMILTATENGYGKCTTSEEYSRIRRGGGGVISIQTNERNGPVVGALEVDPAREVMLVRGNGILIRVRVSEIACVGRNAQGVRLIRIEDGRLVSIERLPISVEEPVEDGEKSDRSY